MIYHIYYTITLLINALNIFVAVSHFQNIILVAIFPLTLLVQSPLCVLLKIKCRTCKELHLIFTSSVVNVISQVLLTSVGGVTGNFRE